MFNAIAHQLRSRYQRHTSQKELRMVAADHIALHREKYADFLEESVEEYCSKLRGTDLWGGHLELDAISSSLQIPIKVYQADAEAIIFGTETSKTPLFIWYFAVTCARATHPLVFKSLPTAWENTTML